MKFIILTSLISSLGIGISLFFGVYLISSKKVQNNILGALLLALSLRITKSVFYHYVVLPLFIKNLGLAANLAIGPLLYLYLRSVMNMPNLFKKSFLLHFIPTICYIICCNYIPNDPQSKSWLISYSFILLQAFFYVFLSIRLYMTKRDRLSKDVKQWLVLLMSSLSGMWLVYTLIFINVLPIYSAGSISFTVLIFLLSFLAFKKRTLFEENTLKKYAKSKMTYAQGNAYLIKLEQLIKEERLYLDPKLTLKSLSEKLDLSPRDISMIINKHTHQNFSSFINTYRIESAKKLLQNYDESTKIISIAFDSGFHSLSSFNTAFKAVTQLTPSEYRSKHTDMLK